MRTLNRTVYYPSRGDTFRLMHLTDLHIGAKACDEKLLEKHVRMIEDDPNMYWIGGGDYIDAICQVGDKRYQPESIAPWAFGYTDIMGVQIEYLLDNYLMRIAHKCWGLGVGNHEYNADKHYGRQVYWDIVKPIAQKAGVAPETLAFGVQGFVVPTFRRGTAESNGNSWKMVIYVHHGFGGGRLPGGHALTLGRILGDYFCDLALLGHRHVFQVVSKYQTVPGDRTARTRESIGVFMPSYLGQYLEPMPNGKPVDTYPELLALPATPLGAFPIVIRPSERKITLEYSSGVIGMIGKAA